MQKTVEVPHFLLIDKGSTAEGSETIVLTASASSGNYEMMVDGLYVSRRRGNSCPRGGCVAV